MTASRRLATLPLLLLIGLAALLALLPTSSSVQAQTNNEVTGRPVILAPVDEAGILFADTLALRDADGLPFSGSALTGSLTFDKYNYQWIRVDGSTETNIGADSRRYMLVDDDIDKLIKVRVSFKDREDNAESVTSQPFGPITEPDPLPASTLVGNTGQVPSAAANINQQYAQGFTLGSHGQGYEISSVSVELAAAPSDLTVSLWIGGHSVYGSTVPHAKLFDFENPASFQAGLNEFTAPGGAFVHHNMRYFIVLSGFDSSLSIKQTTSNNEDAGGETGAVISHKAAVRGLSDTGTWSISTSRASVLRLAVKGSRLDSGILFSNFAQAPDPDSAGGRDQEIISVGDDCCFSMTVGDADRYLNQSQGGMCIW